MENMLNAYTMLAERARINGQSHIVERLISDELKLTLDELLNIDFGLNEPYFETFKYLHIFIKYLDEAPKGIGYTKVIYYYHYALETIPQDCEEVVKSLITEIYYSALAKEIETNNIEELSKWIAVYGQLKEWGFHYKPFDHRLRLRFSHFICKNIEVENINIIECFKLTKIIILAERSGLDVSDLASLTIRTLNSYLSLKYKIYNGGQKRDEWEISYLIGQLKLLKTSSDSDAEQVRILENYFGSLVEQEKNHRNKVFVRDPNLPYRQINFNQLVFKENIFANTRHPSFNVTIERYVCPQNGDIAVKTYEIKNQNYDTQRIINEIDILETLSTLSAPNNSFLKYIGSLSENNRIHLAMEYHPLSLMDVISIMRNDRLRFSEDEMIQHATDLISAFASMHQMKIYHRDITPHNILMTNYKKLKIIDFSVSESKSHDENTISPTGVHHIQGTYGYMAPEIQKHAYNNIREMVRYKLDKADVFSLGITLLQMYNLEVLHTLNEKKNHHKLIEKVNEVRWPWLCTLLNKMLRLRYMERPSIKKCLEMLPRNYCFTTTC